MPRYAFTMGIGTIMDAKKIVLVATGKAKTEILAAALAGEVTPEVPASVLQNHADVLVIADEEAAAGLPANLLA